MICDLLGYGKDNARTAAELSRITGLTHREVVRQIERARRRGEPICASGDSSCRGYYKAATPAELAQYTRALNRRLHTIREGLDALICTLEEWSGQMSLGTGESYGRDQLDQDRCRDV